MSEQLDHAALEVIDRVAKKMAGDHWPTTLRLGRGRPITQTYRAGATSASFDAQRWVDYVATYFPRYLPRLRCALRGSGLDLGELVQLCGAEGRPVRIVDLGAGPGTMTLAALLEIAGLGSRANGRAQPAVDVVLVDRNPDAHEVSKAVLAEMREVTGLGPNVEQTVADLVSWKAKPAWADLIVLGHVLCECFSAGWGVEQTAHWLAQLVKEALSRTGVVVVVEPVEPATKARFVDLREGLRGMSGCRILGPCAGGSQHECPELRRAAGPPYGGAGSAECMGRFHVFSREGLPLLWSEVPGPAGRLTSFLRYAQRSDAFSVSRFSALVLGRTGSPPPRPQQRGVKVRVDRHGQAPRLCAADLSMQQLESNPGGSGQLATFQMVCGQPTAWPR